MDTSKTFICDILVTEKANNTYEFFDTLSSLQGITWYELQNDIWELRTKFAGLQIRLLAFWDKSDNKNTLVIATHGFIKKVDKVQLNEIDRAERLREKYFENKPKQ